MRTVAARAFFRGGARCLLTAPLETYGRTISSTLPVPVVDDAYPYLTRAEDFYPRLHWDGDSDRKMVGGERPLDPCT